MVLGAVVGAGFAAFESAGYALQAMLDHIHERPVVNILETEAFRAPLAPFGHITWTALLGGALFAGSRAGRFHLTKRLAGTFAGVVALHAVWDQGYGWAVMLSEGVTGAGWTLRWPNQEFWSVEPSARQLVWFNVFYDGILAVLGLIGLIWVLRGRRTVRTWQATSRMPPSFADLPARVAALVREHERVALILLDAFGWEFVQRHASHPLLRRMDIEPLSSMFPSTTTAHLTTLYTGLPVETHGLYEWRVYEPRLDQVIVPLRFVSDPDGAELALDPGELVPSPTLFERLDAASAVLQPAHIWPSRYGSAAFAGATVTTFTDLADGVRRLGTPGLSYLYWDAVDAAGHKHGPSSAEFDAAAIAALDAIEAALPRDTLVLMTADHGQIDVDPGRVDLLDQLWPGLSRHLRHGPTGSARDLFLHVDEPEHVIEQLAARLGERATVHRAAELFRDPGPALLRRLGDVCVLPAQGRMAWLAAHPSHDVRFRGHHGGRTAAETGTWLGRLQT